MTSSWDGKRHAPYAFTGQGVAMFSICDKDGVNKSKPIFNGIDTVLARHYGFSVEELNFILNYDIKYRLGRDTGSEAEN